MNIDGITSVTVPLSENIALSIISNLQMDTANDKTTTQTNFYYFKEFKSLFIKIKYKPDEGFSLIITGSLHKYYHGINSNDFYEYELKQTKNKILQYLQLDIAELTKGEFKKVPQLLLPLSKVEVGINFEMGVDDVYTFLKNELQFHKKEPFRNDDGFMFICRHENYHLKLYCKGENLLRFEIVFLTRELKKYKIFSLSDLTKEKIIPMLNRIKKEAAEIIFSDGVNLYLAEGLTKAEHLKLLKYSSSWRNNDFQLAKEKAQTRQRKNMNQKEWRLGVSSKNILAEKGAGYKKLFVEAVSQKIDLFLTQNEIENSCRILE